MRAFVAVLCVATGIPSLAQTPVATAASRRGEVGPLRRELAGKPLEVFPFFQFTRTFNEGDPVRIALDPRSDPGLAKRWVDVYVVPHDLLAQYEAGAKLASIGGAPLSVKLTAGGVGENTFLVDPGFLTGVSKADPDGVVQLGRGYDVIVDVNLNAALDAGDVVDGGPGLAGFYVVEDFVSIESEEVRETGPYDVVEFLYDGGTNFTQQDIYYPSNIAALGEVPLVVVSHGNGHNYQWYDHIGYNLASWGYVVMSHANNTGPGIEAASTTTLRNTEVILERLDTIAGGALAGHVDSHRIVWMGHSRGGEGVVRAYRRLIEGTPIATRYGVDDIRLVSSIAPTDFLGVNVSDMGAAPYHLWTGGADADVNGCASCDICQTFHLLERADGTRFSISLHGAGHGDFHAGGGSSVAAGPCRLRRGPTHQVMRCYLLPLVQYVLHDNQACLDYLTRQWEEFRPIGAPDLTEPCVVVDKMYVPGPERMPVVIDDFQSNPARDLSSSGGAVLVSPGLEPTLVEGRLDDANGNFTVSAVDVMNGMTLAGPGDTAAGIVLEWNATDEWLTLEVPPGARDLSALQALSFRAAQCTRDEITVSELGDLDFTVELEDGGRHASAIRISAYGGGIEEPYQRTSCGQGEGWANEFETIRIPVRDFTRDGTRLDLTNVAAITFRFGPSHGSIAGRLGLDEIEFTRD